MSLALHVWFIQQTDRGFEAIRFIRRSGLPEIMGPYPTIEAARLACGSLDAELL